MTHTSRSALWLGLFATLMTSPYALGNDEHSAKDVSVVTEAAETPLNDDAQPESKVNTADIIRPFTARYKTRYHLGWFEFDIDAERKLYALPDANWRLSFNADASIASLRESSEFRLQDAQIEPLEYRYRSTGMIDESDKTLLFAHSLQQIHDAEKNRVITDQWQSGIQDNLTYMLQASVDLAHGKTDLLYPVFQRNRIKPTHFKVMGEETLNTALGAIRTIRVEQSRDNGKRKIVAWFSPEHHYQLVKLTDREKGKLRYRIDIVSLQF